METPIFSNELKRMGSPERLGGRLYPNRGSRRCTFVVLPRQLSLSGGRPSLRLIFAMWFSIVRPESWTSEASGGWRTPVPPRLRPPLPTSEGIVRFPAGWRSLGGGNDFLGEGILCGLFGRHRHTLGKRLFPRTLIAKHVACGAHPAFVIVRLKLQLRKGNDADFLA